MDCKRSTRLLRSAAQAKLDMTYQDEPYSEDEAEMSGPRKRTRKEEDSDYEEPSMGPVRAVKRSRTTKNRKNGKGSRNAGKLSQSIARLPMDMWLEVFGHLPIETLCTLLQVSKIFQDTLRSPENLAVWRKARLLRGAPEPPEHLNEVDWALLLFGPRFCEVCRRTRVHKVNFALMRRICKACTRETTMTTTEILSEYEGIRGSIYDILMSCSRLMQPTYLSNNTDIPLFNRSEVELVLGQCYYVGEPYIESRKEELMYLQAHAELCENWQKEMKLARSEEIQATRMSRLDAVKRRLTDMGYSEEDLELVYFERTATQSTPLTDRIWNNIKPKVVAAVNRFRILRMFKRLPIDYTIEDHSGSVLERRREMIETVFLQYRKSLRPAQWRELPNICAIALLPSFERLLGAPNDAHIAATDLEQVMNSEQLQKEMDRFVKEHRDQIIGTRSEDAMGYIRCKICWSTYNDFSSVVRHIHSEECSCLDENTSDASNYEYGDYAPILDFLRGSDSQTDPSKSHTNVLDNTESFYKCTSCYKWGTWRECIAHYDSDTKFHWGIAQRDLPYFVSIGIPPIPDDRTTWSCNHCTIHAEGPATRAEVIKHLREAHDVHEPSVPEDFFFIH
ncbi:hypothetical protein VNI00_007777 [Paramarasmius palmivorus]|uniref:F-box domain-containing protein n=1 Tax=Paramarasmius palmivorus TaxID=297713 RepID=A0AAW0CV98_9AGAR